MTTKRIPLTSESDLGQIVDGAVAVLQNGGVILYPTDTVYGLGADALSDDAVQKVRMIKQRDELKNILCIVSGMEMAETIGITDQRAELLAEAYLPGPLTFVLPKRPQARTGIGRGAATIGVRVPDNNLCLALAEAFEGPITSTSANIAGKETLRSVSEILEQLGEGANDIDLIIDAGRLPRSEPSTIVDISKAKTDILREGPISIEDVMAVLE